MLLGWFMPIEFSRVEHRVHADTHFPLSTPASRGRGKDVDDMDDEDDVDDLVDMSGYDPLEIVPPAYVAHYGGKKFYLSEPYRSGNYPVVFAYVENEQGVLQPRVLYFSQSRAMWRVAPVIDDNRFGKGYNLERHINLPPELNMAMTQLFTESIENPSLLHEIENMQSVMAAFSQPMKNPFDGTCAAFVEEVAKESRPTLCTRIEGTRKFQIEDHLDMPNLESDDSLSFSYNNPFYASLFHDAGSEDRSDFQLKTVPSYNGKYRYLIGEVERDGEPYLFVLSAAYQPVVLSSFLVPTETPDFGYDNLCPIVRYDSMMRVMNVGGQKKFYNEAPYLDIKKRALSQPINSFLNLSLELREEIISSSPLDLLLNRRILPDEYIQQQFGEHYHQHFFHHAINNERYGAVFNLKLTRLGGLDEATKFRVGVTGVLLDYLKNHSKYKQVVISLYRLIRHDHLKTPKEIMKELLKIRQVCEDGSELAERIDYLKNAYYQCQGHRKIMHNHTLDPSLINVWYMAQLHAVDCTQEQRVLQAATAVLQTYVDKKSFFTNHKQEVRELIRQVDSGAMDLSSLLTSLESISEREGYNQQGSLEQRIHFIDSMLGIDAIDYEPYESSQDLLP